MGFLLCQVCGSEDEGGRLLSGWPRRRELQFGWCTAVEEWESQAGAPGEGVGLILKEAALEPSGWGPEWEGGLK